MKIYNFIAIVSFGFFANSLYSQPSVNTALGGSAQKVPNINSKADDHAPFIARNGLTMYFASNRFGKTHIYYSKRKDLNSPWPDPEYCKITSNPQDYVNYLSLDGIGKFYFESNRETRIKGDINIWEGFGLDSVTTIRPLPDPVNTIKWEGQPSVTNEGKDIYFVSNRESPAGSLEMLADIFVTHRNSDGTWTAPQNLGPQINIGIYNTTPFISPDGRFLFFASKEKKGIEIKRKIYMSERTGPKDIDWAKPVLLPSPINSDKDDIGPMVASDGKTIYFSSNRDGGSGLDIYEAELPQKIQTLIYESFVKK
ncbi:MAG: hypothetical protein ACHQM6_02935 [Candidatus Kapaibacterium sp.]